MICQRMEIQGPVMITKMLHRLLCEPVLMLEHILFIIISGLFCIGNRTECFNVYKNIICARIYIIMSYLNFCIKLFHIYIFQICLNGVAPSCLDKK